MNILRLCNLFPKYTTPSGKAEQKNKYNYRSCNSIGYYSDGYIALLIAHNAYTLVAMTIKNRGIILVLIASMKNQFDMFTFFFNNAMHVNDAASNTTDRLSI